MEQASLKEKVLLGQKMVQPRLSARERAARRWFTREKSKNSPRCTSGVLYITSDSIELDGGINTYGYVGGNPLKYFDLFGLDAQMCYRPFYPILQPYVPHCFLEFTDGSSSSFDPDGTHEDPAPDRWPKSCQDTEGEQDDDCLKKAMKKCKGDKYYFTGFNCCHYVEEAMKECGLSIPRDNWPNWPVNPGPQLGELGYSSRPQYGVPKL